MGEFEKLLDPKGQAAELFRDDSWIDISLGLVTKPIEWPVKFPEIYDGMWKLENSTFQSISVPVYYILNGFAINSFGFAS